MALTVFSEITPLPERASGTKPDADGELWNTRYTEVNLNFELLEGGSAGEFWQAGGGWAVPAGSGVTNGHIIEDEGTPLTQRGNLDFIGGGVTAADGATATEVTIPSSEEEITAASEKTTPVDADKLGIFDSAAAGVLKWLSWANLKTALDYVALTGAQTIAGIKTFSSFPVTPSSAPSADYEVANKKYVDDNAGGGRTYNAVTVTTANVTAVEDNHYDLTIAGLTAERKFVLPTPSAVDVTISMRILDGDDTYSIMPQANSVDLDGYNLFMAGESLVWRSTGTGATDWEIAEGGNGKIKTIASQRASVAQTGLATATNYKAVLGTAMLDTGSLNDTANNRIVVRRAGKYKVTPKVVWQANANASQSNYAKTYVNGIYDSGFLTPNSANELITIIHPKEFEASAGDYFECYAIQNSEINRDLYYSLANGLWAQLTVEEM